MKIWPLSCHDIRMLTKLINLFFIEIHMVILRSKTQRNRRQKAYLVTVSDVLNKLHTNNELLVK